MFLFHTLSRRDVFVSAATIVADSDCFRAIMEDLATCRLAGFCSMVIDRCTAIRGAAAGRKALTPATQARTKTSEHFMTGLIRSNGEGLVGGLRSDLPYFRVASFRRRVSLA